MGYLLSITVMLIGVLWRMLNILAPKLPNIGICPPGKKFYALNWYIFLAPLGVDTLSINSLSLYRVLFQDRIFVTGARIPTSNDQKKKAHTT